MKKVYDVFISHSSEDKPIPDAVCHALEKAGIRCWISSRDIPRGNDWDDEIAMGIEQSSVMVLVVSPNSLSSTQVKNEFYLALEYEKKIIPFKVKQVELRGGWALQLKRINWLDAVTPSFESHLEELCKEVQKSLLPDQQRPESAASSSGLSPEPEAVPSAPGQPTKTAIPPSETTSEDDKAHLDGTPPGYDPSRAKIASLFEQADQAEKNRNWSVAIELYQDILALSPGHSDADKFLARAREKARMATPESAPSPSETPQPESDLPPLEDVPTSAEGEREQVSDVSHERAGAATTAEAETVTSPPELQLQVEQPSESPTQPDSAESEPYAESVILHPEPKIETLIPTPEPEVQAVPAPSEPQPEPMPTPSEAGTEIESSSVETKAETEPLPSESRPEAVSSPEVQSEPVHVSPELPSQPLPPSSGPDVEREVARSTSRHFSLLGYGLIAVVALAAIVLFLIRPTGRTVNQRALTSMPPTQQTLADISNTQELLAAAYQGDLKRVMDLLSKGVDVNSKGKEPRRVINPNEDRTALMEAVIGGNLEVVKLLLVKGADVNAEDSCGNECGNTALALAIYSDNGKILKLLVDKGADVNAKSKNGETPLILAASHGNPELVKLLLDKGANPNAKNNWGKTALDSANQTGDTKVVKLLKARGAR